MAKFKRGDWVRTTRKLDLQQADGPVIPRDSLGQVVPRFRNQIPKVHFEEYGDCFVDPINLRRVFPAWVVTGDKQAVSELGGDAINYYEFATQAEVNAFVQGIEATDGWIEASVYFTEEEAENHVEEYHNDEELTLG